MCLFSCCEIFVKRSPGAPKGPKIWNKLKKIPRSEGSLGQRLKIGLICFSLSRTETRDMLHLLLSRWMETLKVKYLLMFLSSPA